MNNSKELNKELEHLICEKMKNNLVEILKKQKYRTLCLCGKNKDKVYGYLYDCDCLIVEKRVVGIQLDEEENINVCLDYDYVDYTLEDLVDNDKTLDDQWHSLLSGELLGWFTMININEVIHEYI